MQSLEEIVTKYDMVLAVDVTNMDIADVKVMVNELSELGYHPSYAKKSDSCPIQVTQYFSHDK